MKPSDLPLTPRPLRLSERGGGETANFLLSSGSWLSPTKPTLTLSAVRQLALPPANSAEYVSKVLVSAGTRYQIGTAAKA
jgi:hypothetical protein